MPPLKRKTSSASLTSGSRIPVLSQPTSPKDNAGSRDVSRTTSVATSPAHVPDGKAAERIHDDLGMQVASDDDDNWDTESDVSDGEDLAATIRPPAEKDSTALPAGLGHEKHENPAEHMTASANLQQDDNADAESSDFSLHESEHSPAPAVSGHRPLVRSESLKQAADLGLDDFSLAESEERSRLDSSLSDADGTMSPFQSPKAVLPSMEDSAEVHTGTGILVQKAVGMEDGLPKVHLCTYPV